MAWPTNDEEARKLEAEVQATLPAGSKVTVHLSKAPRWWMLALVCLGDLGVVCTILGTLTGGIGAWALGLSVLWAIVRPVRLALFPGIGSTFREV